MGIIQKLFGTHSEHELKRIYPIVDKIEALRPSMQALTDEQLRAKTDEFKKRLADGETLDDILPEAFATVREAAKRAIGMEHYRVQLIGGIILHQGRIAEMRTGEGKTLVSTLPAYLNALEGKGVHVITVNDYLASRDAEWMGQVHRFLGLTVGVVLNDMKPEERREAYRCDITYVTNNELGFDYLRDNMAVYKENLVLRDLRYAIIDEVDSVLIDEARTPLIISGQGNSSTKLYEVCDILARQLEKGTSNNDDISKMDIIMGAGFEETGDFVVSEKDKTVNLTEQGTRKVEKFFHLENLADPANLEIQHNVILALRAHYLMFRDKDYVVANNEVLIVDEFTGRIMPGRRFSDGLHQAIEAKEHVKVSLAEQELKQVKAEIRTDKLKSAATDVATAITSSVGSLFGSGKLKDLEQSNENLRHEIAKRDKSFDDLKVQMQQMQEQHGNQIRNLQGIHNQELEAKDKEISRLNTILEKAFNWFPLLKEMLRMEKLCYAIGFTKDMVNSLLTKKEAIRCNGKIYSEEHRRRFEIKNDIFKVEKSPIDENKLVLTINRQPIGEWFKEQWEKLRQGLRQSTEEPRKSRGFRM